MDALSGSVIAYYDAHAREYFERSARADMSAAYARFEAYLPAGGQVLDLGCGSGRDTLEFAKRGYDVTSVDGSKEMCRLARKHTGRNVLNLRFDEISFTDRFNGIWACASLLHVPKREMPAILQILELALRPGGVLYASYKYGLRERYEDGRLFSDYNELSIPYLFPASCGMHPIECWLSADVRTGREDEKWINVICRKNAAYGT
ncbi:MAG: class I SAM-dependent methyltransferase [Clostridia bacterium]|nr:class I SAM-dependent methyltransferase [Clostridia bacterium]